MQTHTHTHTHTRVTAIWQLSVRECFEAPVSPRPPLSPTRSCIPTTPAWLRRLASGIAPAFRGGGAGAGCPRAVRLRQPHVHRLEVRDAGEMRGYGTHMLAPNGLPCPSALDCCYFCPGPSCPGPSCPPHTIRSPPPRPVFPHRLPHQCPAPPPHPGPALAGGQAGPGAAVSAPAVPPPARPGAATHSHRPYTGAQGRAVGAAGAAPGCQGGVASWGSSGAATDKRCCWGIVATFPSAPVDCVAFLSLGTSTAT